MLTAGTAVSKLEETAFATDSGVMAAQETVTADGTAIMALKKQFQASLPDNADYAAAKSAMDAAKAKITDAVAKLDSDKGIAAPAPVASATPADSTPAPAPAAAPTPVATPAADAGTAAPAAATGTDPAAAATPAAN
jgi:hypothetical protein